MSRTSRWVLGVAISVTSLVLIMSSSNRVVSRFIGKFENVLDFHIYASRGVQDDPIIGRRHAVSHRGLASKIAYPIQISSDRRHLVDGSGNSIVINGDTPWSLAVQLTRPEVRTYLDHRVGLGLNAIMFNLIEHRYGDENPNPWTNQYGDEPFTRTLTDGSLDFSFPNETYWSEIDWIINEAEARGIICFLVPAYVGYKHNSAGWARELDANGAARIRAYGEFLGNRYGGYGNVVWVMGGDWGPTSQNYDVTDTVNALATGLSSAAPNQLMTAHANRDDSALDDYPEPWLQLNSTYAQPTTVAAEVRNDYLDRDPVYPTFFIEGRYENEGPSPREIRAQYYQAILGGASGHLYGASNVWYFDAQSGERFADTPSDTWHEALDYPGAQHLAALEALLQVRDVLSFIPDYSDRLITRRGGEPDNQNYAPCRVRMDRQAALCYLPTERKITIDFGQLTFDSMRVAWYDPAEGTSVVDTTMDPVGPTMLTPPDQGDWVLLLDDAARDLPLPSSGT